MRSLLHCLLLVVCLQLGCGYTYYNINATLDNKYSNPQIIGSGKGVTIVGGSEFGSSVTFMDDIDGDGTDDVAVGNPGAGTVWLLCLYPNNTVKRATKLTNTTSAGFGFVVCNVGDRDGNSVSDILIGINSTNQWYIFFLQSTGVSSSSKLITTYDAEAAAVLGDANNDTFDEIVLSNSQVNGYVILVTSSASTFASWTYTYANNTDCDLRGQSLARYGNIDNTSEPCFVTACGDRSIQIRKVTYNNVNDTIGQALSYTILFNTTNDNCGLTNCKYGRAITVLDAFNNYREYLVGLPGINRLERYSYEALYGPFFTLDYTEVKTATKSGTGGLASVSVANGASQILWPTSISSNIRWKTSAYRKATKIIVGMSTYYGNGVANNGAVIIVDNVNVARPSYSPSKSLSPSRTRSQTPSRSFSSSRTPSSSISRSPSASISRSPSSSRSLSASISRSLTPSRSLTASISRSHSPSRSLTASMSRSLSPSHSLTASISRSPSRSFSRSSSPSLSRSPSHSDSPSRSLTRSLSPSPAVPVVVEVQPDDEVVTDIVLYSNTVLEFTLSPTGTIGTLIFNRADSQCFSPDGQIVIDISNSGQQNYNLTDFIKYPCLNISKNSNFSIVVKNSNQNSCEDVIPEVEYGPRSMSLLMNVQPKDDCNNDFGSDESNDALMIGLIVGLVGFVILIVVIVVIVGIVVVTIKKLELHRMYFSQNNTM